MVTNYANKNTSKLLVAVLAMLMIVAGAAVVLGDTVSAADPETDDTSVANVSTAEELATALSSEDVTTINLTKDIDLRQIDDKNGYVIGKAVTINGDNHTISGNLYNDPSAKLIVVQNVNTNNAKVVFNDVKLAGALNVYKSNVDLNNVAITVNGLSGLIVGDTAIVKAENLSITGNYGVWGGFVNVDKGGDFTVDTISGVGSIYSETLGTSAITVEDAPVYVQGTGTWAGYYADIDDALKAVKGTSSTEATVTVNGSTTLDGDYTGVNKFTTLNITVTENGNLRNNGKIAFTDFTVDGRFTNNSDGVVDGANAIDGTGKIVNDGTMNAAVLVENYTNNNTSEIKLSGDSTGTNWYPAKQTITVPAGETWTIIKDNIIVIPGTLNVLGNLVVEEGGVLVIGAAQCTGDNTRVGAGTANVEGTLTVEEGAVLSVAMGQLNIEGTANIDGTVKVGYGFDTIANMSDDPTVENANAKINVNSNTTLSETSEISQVDGTKVVVAQDVTMTLEGVFATAVTFDNSGAVIIDSQPTDASKNNAPVACGVAINVNMMADGASVEIQNLAVNKDGKVIVDDANLVVNNRTGVTIGDYKADASDSKVYNNRMKFDSNGTDAVISGLTIVENYDGLKAVAGDATKKVPQNTMDLSGSISVSDLNRDQDADGKVRIYLNNGNFTITDAGDATALAIGAGATLAVMNQAELTVSGYVPVSADSTAPGDITNAGEITLAGNGHIYIKDSNDKITTDNVNASMYETLVNADRYNNYVTVDAAIAAANADSTIDEITLYGENTVTASATVPAIDFSFDKAVLYIGSEDDRTVTLTIAAGANYNGTVGSADGVDAGKATVVYGTLYFTDKTDRAMSEDTIDADVRSYQVDAEGKDVKNGWARYTNVYTAMDAAVAGDVIEVFDGAKVELDRDFTVKEGVTLIVPENGQIKVMNGVTLTVAGTLQSENPTAGIVAENEFADIAENNTATADGKKTSAIVVTGTLKVMEDRAYKAATVTEANKGTLQNSWIDGAYYTDGEYNYVSPIAVAVSATVLPTIENDITVYGTVAEGDIAFAPNDNDCNQIIIADGAKVTLSSLTLSDRAILDVSFTSETVYGLFTGTVTVGDASIQAVNVRDLTVNSASGLTVTDADVKYDDKKAETKVDASLSATAGTVIVANVDGDMTVAEGATLTVATPASANQTTDGTVTGKLTVNGTVTLASGQNLLVNGTLFVNGTVDVAAATDTAVAGSLNVDNNAVTTDGYNGIVYVGLSDKFKTTGTGAVNGLVGCATIYAVAGATVSDATIGVGTANEKDSTEYYIEDTLWMTAYGAGNIVADNMENAPVENAYFNNVWQNEAGDATYDNVESTVSATNPAIGSVDAVYAVIEYDIYVINLRADQNAISSISIDGNIMQFGMIQDTTAGSTGYYYGYTAVVAAGSHTISYQLANGYSGNGVLTVNGTQMSDLTFTTEGNPADGKQTVTYNLQLTGFEKSGYVPDSPDTGDSGSSDSGMTITDYLLIVLVVLIIVMAIIVAMRLMRS